MATTRTYQDMLNEYLPNELFAEEFLKRDWYLTNMEKDNGWKGGDIIVPFRGAGASSVKFGGLTDTSDVHESAYVRGKISGYKEIWGTLIFNETDIMQHDGSIKEQSFLKLLPDEIEAFMTYMQMVTSINLLCGPHFATVTDATNAATGIMIVDKIDRFALGQKCDLDDSDSAPATVYVTAIDVNTKAVTLSLSRDGAAADVSAYSVAQVAKFYHDGILVAGVVTNNFTSARSILLSAANGGGTTVHGKTKTAYPILQAVNIDGAAITAANILDSLFDAWSEIKIRAKAANPSKCVMSFKNLGSVIKLIESDKSPFKVSVGQTKVTKYGWTEIDIVGVRGGFTIVGIQEVDDDIIAFLDMTAMTFRTNGFFQKKKGPKGEEFYRIRGPSGYQLVTDICLFGEQEFRKPAACGIIHTVAY